MGLGAMYLNKKRVNWFERNDTTEITMVDSQTILPMPYVGINKRFDDSFVRKIAVNVIHAPRVSGHNDIAVTYLQAKFQLNF